MKTLEKTFLAVSVSTLVALQGCASADLNHRLDEKVAQESNVHNRRDLDAKATNLLKETPGLSAQQRTSLEGLKAKVATKLRENNAASLKLRALLLNDVLSGGDHAQEIQDVKSRLRKLSKERIDTIFEAVDQANDLLGRSALVREAMDLQMMEDQTEF